MIMLVSLAVVNRPLLSLDPDGITLQRLGRQIRLRWDAPAELIAQAAEFDLDQHVTRQEWKLGTGDEGYPLDSDNVPHFGEPEALAILLRREPCAAFAYLNPYG